MLIAVAIAAGAFEPFYFRMLTADRAAMSRGFTELPYRKLPGLRRFFADVRARTKPGDVIVMYTPNRYGYGYFFDRAAYNLPGRTSLPLFGDNQRPLPQNVDRADYIASFNAAPDVPGFTTVWRGPDGVLLRRVRR